LFRGALDAITVRTAPVYRPAAKRAFFGGAPRDVRGLGKRGLSTSGHTFSGIPLPAYSSRRSLYAEIIRGKRSGVKPRENGKDTEGGEFGEFRFDEVSSKMIGIMHSQPNE
jgi:hypothetical protein